MQYRRLGKTELLVSEVGFGGEWLERHNYEECKAMIDRQTSWGSIYWIAGCQNRMSARK